MKLTIRRVENTRLTICPDPGQNYCIPAGGGDS
jgi:hypothetical protein